MQQYIIGLGFVAIGLVVAILARRKLRAEARQWTEHKSRHEQTDTARSLTERRW